MSKKLNTAVIVALSVCMQLGQANAQQTPSSGSTASAPKAPAAKPSASKTGTSSTAAKSTAAKSPAPLALTTQKQKASYAIGLSVGTGLRRDAVEVDPAVLLRGIKDAIAGSKPLLSDAEIQSVMTALQNDVRQRQQAQASLAAATNKQAGDAFLAANKAKEGVVTLPSGLQYKVLKAGIGPKPTASDTVVCNYRGTLLDNTEFDSSYKRGQPASFPLNHVIKGWTEALQLMPVGSKWQLFIPPDLAYGDHPPQGSDIGPNATLVFEIDLLSIQGK